MRYLFVALVLFTSASLRADDLIPLDTPWKKTVSEFAELKLRHSAWGFAHSKRNYLLAVELAEEEGITVDKDVLLAAAFLHDMGGFPEFEKTGVDHAVRSAELFEAILVPAGFPVGKLAAVKGVILAHTYYNPALPVTAEEKVFRDADVLDFLGAVGFARIVSITGKETFTPDLVSSVDLVGKLLAQLPSRLVTGAAKPHGTRRAGELRGILDSLARETRGGKAL